MLQIPVSRDARTHLTGEPVAGDNMVMGLAYTASTFFPPAKISKGVQIATKGTQIAVQRGTFFLTKGELLRIENAATRINRSINIVGSRATGKAGAYSDWDYVIEGINRRSWNKIKNSLPGSKSILNNTPGNIDLFRGTLDPTKPYITIYPRHIIP
jgi:hypothetical protein